MKDEVPQKIPVLSLMGVHEKNGNRISLNSNILHLLLVYIRHLKPQLLKSILQTNHADGPIVPDYGNAL